MVQDTYQNGVGSALFVSGVLSNSALFTYAWFFQATPVQVGPGPPKSAQVNPKLQVLPGSPRFSQVLPGSPRKLMISCVFVGFRDFLGDLGVIFCVFVDFRISWENLGVIFCVFVGFRDFLGEPGCYFLCFVSFRDFLGEPAFVGFPGFPGRTWVETVGDGLGRAARVSSGKSGWRVARYFDPQFLNFCRRRCRPLWPAGLPRFKV